MEESLDPTQHSEVKPRFNAVSVFDQPPVTSLFRSEELLRRRKICREDHAPVKRTLVPLLFFRLIDKMEIPTPLILLLVSFSFLFNPLNLVSSATVPPSTPIKAVNLGGWLVTEGWIKPSLFDGIVNKDLLVCLDSFHLEFNIDFKNLFHLFFRTVPKSS